jgi:hypothetical protein
MNTLEWALWWAGRGFRVFPLAPNTKRPAGAGFLESATRDPEAIRAAWTDKFTGLVAQYNVGAVPDNQILVDFDTKDGKQGIKEGEQLGFNFDTLLTRTATGGLHAWYAGPPTANTASTIAPGIDTRGPQGYAVMPGSTVDGRQYELIRDMPLAPVQQFVLDKLRAPRERMLEQAPLVDLDLPSAISAAQNYLAAQPGAVRGEQNHTTFRLAAHLRDLGLSETMADELLDTLWAVRCEPQIPSEEVAQLVANAYLYAQNAPGSKHPMADFGGVVVWEPPAPPALPDPRQMVMFNDNPFACFGNMVPVQELKPRNWIVKRLLERDAVTALIAPGGVGKSQLTLTIAVYLALGVASIFGFENVFAGVPRHSIIYNAEDDENEMSARLHALCVVLEVDPERVRPYICLVSGRRQRFKLYTRQNGQVAIAPDADGLVNWLVAACLQHNVVMVGFDPLTKLHEFNENDNIDMGRMMESLNRIAERCATSILLAQHMAKASLAGAAAYAGNAGAGRGAGEIINGARAAYTLSPPTPEDVNYFQLSLAQQYRLLRLDNAKLNRSLLTPDATWIEKVGVLLFNGEEVGAFQPADPRAESEELKLSMARFLSAEMTALSTGAIPVREAAEILMRVDSAYSQLSNRIVVARLERMLHPPITISESGIKLGISLKGSARLVTMQ